MTRTVDLNRTAMDSVIIEIKLHINRKLFERGAITEEMFNKAKEIIIRD